MTLIKVNKFQPIVIYPLMMTVTYLANIVFIVISTDYYNNSKPKQSNNSNDSGEFILKTIVKNEHNIILLFVSYFFQSLTLILSYVQKRKTLKNKQHKMELIPGNKLDKLLVLVAIFFLAILILIKSFIKVSIDTYNTVLFEFS